MFKCAKCKKNSEKGETMLKRYKYEKAKDKLGNIVRGNIIREEKVCFKCFKKYGAEIK